MLVIHFRNHFVHCWQKSLILACALVMGCGKAPAPEIAQQDGSDPSPRKEGGPAPKRLQASFQNAIRANPPENALPPTQTVTGKSVGKVYTQVEKEWPSIQFASADGGKLAYRATLETDAGAVIID